LGFDNWDANGLLDNKNGWSFATRSGNPEPGGEAVVKSGGATGVGAPRQGRLQFSAKFPVSGPLDLRTAVLTLDAFLQEVNGAGELVNDHTNLDFSPLTLLAPRGARETQAEFTTPRGRLPQVKVRLKVERGELDVRLQVDRASIESPQQCAGDFLTTRLQLRLRVDDGVHAPVELVSHEHWTCDTDHSGKVSRLSFPSR
jgi:hypothetical protein